MLAPDIDLIDRGGVSTPANPKASLPEFMPPIHQKRSGTTYKKECEAERRVCRTPQARLPFSTIIFDRAGSPLERLPGARNRSCCTCSESLEYCSELRILLLHLQLSPRRFGVRQRVDDITLGPRDLRCSLEIRERLVDLALLEQELRQGADSDIAFRIHCSLVSIYLLG